MAHLVEVAVTSDASGTNCCLSVWDPHAGTNLMLYKGGGSAEAHSISFIGNKFVAAANSSKPLIHIWPVNSQEQVSGMRFVTPGRVTAMAITPDGCYCIAGIAESIYIWQICSGKLLVVLARHYQSVTSIKCTDDSSHFVSGGKDGMALVWNLGHVIQAKKTQHASALYTFSDHALSVTDMYLTKGGMSAYLATVSLDRTCKIYDLSAGQLLLSLVFEEPLSAVTIDALDFLIYVGSTGGRIYKFCLQRPPRMRDYHVDNTEHKNCFSGHKGTVTCLSTSLDGETLLSGGNDEQVIVWDIASMQLIRSIPHKGIITNAFFYLAPESMFNQEMKLNLISSNFKKMIEVDNDDGLLMDILVENDGDFIAESDTYTHASIQSTVLNCSEGSSDELDKLRLEVKNLKRANKEMFEYASKHILKQV